MAVSVETGTWHVDQAASTVTVKHKTFWGMATVKGTFTTVSGQGEVRPDGTATGSITVDAASLDTGNTKRDTHLRSADFFDAEKHPALTLAVDNAEAGPDDTVTITGRLTARDVTRPQALTARVTSADAEAVTLDTEFTVDRAQFGMSWNQLGMLRGLTTVAATLRFTRTPA